MIMIHTTNVIATKLAMLLLAITGLLLILRPFVKPAHAMTVRMIVAASTLLLAACLVCGGS